MKPIVGAILLAVFASACGGDEASSTGSPTPPEAGAPDPDPDAGGVPDVPRSLVDPGSGAWELVAESDVADVCRLDPAILAEVDATVAELGATGWAVVRYGRLCHEYTVSGSDAPTQVFSATKTLGAVVTGIASYQTRDLPRAGRKTGPLSDMDRADHWLDDITFNQDALIAHVLGMVGHDASLAPGSREFAYDGVGDVQINRLSEVVNTAVAQDSGRLGANIEELTQRFLFGPLGMTSSSWGDGATEKNYAFTWVTTLQDMARLGLMLLNGGVWSGERVLDAQWVYRMTHPSFEDANTAYGYLTWLAANANWINIGGPKLAEPGVPCMPAALWPEYPHEPSAMPDCGYGGASCEQEYDVGVWFAAGLFGQFVFGHPGLDMVVVAKDLHPGEYDPLPSLNALYPPLMRAVAAEDPKYQGDVDAFCEAYAAGRYAPDLRE